MNITIITILTILFLIGGIFVLYWLIKSDEGKIEKPKPIEPDDYKKWKLLKRVNCPKCHSAAEIRGHGCVSDKVRCRARCGQLGWFDGVYVRWIK